MARRILQQTPTGLIEGIDIFVSPPGYAGVIKHVSAAYVYKNGGLKQWWPQAFDYYEYLTSQSIVIPNGIGPVHFLLVGAGGGGGGAATSGATTGSGGGSGGAIEGIISNGGGKTLLFTSGGFGNNGSAGGNGYSGGSSLLTMDGESISANGGHGGYTRTTSPYGGAGGTYTINPLFPASSMIGHNGTTGSPSGDGVGNFNGGAGGSSYYTTIRPTYITRGYAGTYGGTWHGGPGNRGGGGGGASGSTNNSIYGNGGDGGTGVLLLWY